MNNQIPNLPPEYHSGTRLEVRSFLPQNYKTVLEIGCGDGGFWNGLESNAQIWGVEPSKGPASIAAPKAYKVICGTYEEASETLPNNHFDLVICNDVIEHMPDHDAFFSSIKTKLSPRGVLVGSIPNIRHHETLHQLIFEKDFEYKDSGVLDRTHLRFFTRKSLIRCFNQHKFEIQAFGGINRSRAKSMRYRLSLLTMSRHQDIRYLQFAFRVAPVQQPQKNAQTKSLIRQDILNSKYDESF